MRTGPFSDPVLVTLINRYFVPLHLDNQDWPGPRYGIKPGEENAYIILETPAGSDGEGSQFRLLNLLRQVLEPENARAELRAFLEEHKELRQPWPELARLEKTWDSDSRLRRAELLLEEGEAARALELLGEASLPPHAALLRASALRLSRLFTEAAAALEGQAPTAQVELERIRLAVEGGEETLAAKMLDEFLSRHAHLPEAAEAYFLRGWLHHRAGKDDEAAKLWSEGLERHPPEAALFSQKAYLTLIRANWDLPANVDQPR